MKGKSEFAVLFFVIAVLAFYIYSDKKEKTHYELPGIEKINADDISRIIIRKKSGEITLLREDGQWFAGERKYKADGPLIETMTGHITGLTLTALASESKNYAIYELDEERRIEVEAYNNGELLRKIIIGKPAESYRHTFVMIDDDHRVYHSKGNIKSIFDRKVSDLRDRTVMAFTDEITGMTLEKGDGKLEVVRAASPATVDMTAEEKEEQKDQEAGPEWTTVDGRAVKGEEIEGIIRTMSGLQCDEFLEDVNKDDLKNPVFTITLTGAHTYSISVYEKKEDKYRAVSSESRYPFLMSEWKVNKIMKDPAGLIK